MTCATPISAGILADYWLASLPAAEEETVEEHLLDCDPCSARLRELIALIDGVRRLAREGSLQMVVSEAFLERAAEQGLRVRTYAPPSGGSVQCTVTAEDDFLIARLGANLTGAKRVDLCVSYTQGVDWYRLPDIPIHVGADSVLMQQSITYAKAAASGTMIARLVTVDDAGGERLLGEYTFHHTRTLPGPGVS